MVALVCPVPCVPVPPVTVRVSVVFLLIVMLPPVRFWPRKYIPEQPDALDSGRLIGLVLEVMKTILVPRSTVVVLLSHAGT